MGYAGEWGYGTDHGAPKTAFRTIGIVERIVETPMGTITLYPFS